MHMIFTELQRSSGRINMLYKAALFPVSTLQISVCSIFPEVSAILTDGN